MPSAISRNELTIMLALFERHVHGWTTLEQLHAVLPHRSLRGLREDLIILVAKQWVEHSTLTERGYKLTTDGEHSLTDNTVQGRGHERR